jgi:hypothetical protein
MSFASIQKITSQTTRISRTLVFLCTGVTIFPTCFCFIVVYRFDRFYDVWKRSCEGNANIEKNP